MDRKAISLMLSYVLLIVIVIAVAVGVYSWLRFVAGGAEGLEKCPEDVYLIIQDYECVGNQRIQLTIENRGLRNVSGYSIRGTNNKSQETWFKLEEVTIMKEKVEGMYLFFSPLPPGAIDLANFSYEGIPEDKIEKIGVGPFRIQEEGRKKQIVFCEDAVINQEVNCT